ncbi:MAG: hypothetical protein EA361_10650 [Bacteroidetes bacterium]|nr:MAG: hypothetical protein EA361_10650 [Bacteroidota bacterium]
MSKLIRNLWRPAVIVFAGIFIVFSSCSSDNEDDLFDDCDTIDVSYADFIVPLMASHCNSCHSGDFPIGNIITATYEGVKAIADNGSLVGSVNHASGYRPMPEGQPQLPECPRLKIAAWVADGAKNN